MRSYSCPAGSALIFTESLWHAGASWTHPDHPRVAIFNCYNALSSQLHKQNLDPALIEAMPVKRQSLFRGVWVHDFTVRPHTEGANRRYSRQNQAQ